MGKIRIISEKYIKENTPLTENNQMKDIFPHIDTAQEVHLQYILGSDLYEDILNKFDQQILNPDEVKLMNDYIKPALLYRTLYLALPFIQYNLRNKGFMVNTDDAATAATQNQFLFMYNIVRDRAIGNEEILKQYLCKNDRLFPKYINPDGLIKPDKKRGNTGGLYFY